MAVPTSPEFSLKYFCANEEVSTILPVLEIALSGLPAKNLKSNILKISGSA